VPDKEKSLFEILNTVTFNDQAARRSLPWKPKS